ncbi:hypothetical protein [Conexibacter sp. DBS9H8]|uniref:hypothetical protein n=1 Tax=Conexibacter sp. DBS9H8 TaxID=2937801 RepID=UPI00200F9CBC|nr:hypothetical protein [Conexibacter sp. DBS9H8]
MEPRDDLIRCARCHRLKPPSSFNWRRRAIGQRDTYCRPCRADYKHEHYTRNRQRYIDNAAARRARVVRERMSLLIAYFASHPCVDCGESDPRVLEFDHQRDKAFDIGAGMRDRPWTDVLEEIDKCEVRCANCHRRRTAQQFGFLRALLMESEPSPSEAKCRTDFRRAGDGN